MKKFIASLLVICLMLPTFFSFTVSAEMVPGDIGDIGDPTKPLKFDWSEYAYSKFGVDPEEYPYVIECLQYGTNDIYRRRFYFFKTPLVLSSENPNILVSPNIINDSVLTCELSGKHSGGDISYSLLSSSSSQNILLQSYFTEGISKYPCGCYFTSVGYERIFKRCNFSIENVYDPDSEDCPLELVSSSAELMLTNGQFHNGVFRMIYDVKVKNNSRYSQDFYVTFDKKPFVNSGVIFKSQEHLESYLKIAPGGSNWDGTLYPENSIEARTTDNYSSLITNMPVTDEFYINVWLASDISSDGTSINNSYYRKCFGSSSATDLRGINPWEIIPGNFPEIDIGDVEPGKPGGNDVPNGLKNPLERLNSWLAAVGEAITTFFESLFSFFESLFNGLSSMVERLTGFSAFLKQSFSFLPDEIINTMIFCIQASVVVCLIFIFKKIIGR